MSELDVLFGGVQHYVTIRDVEYEVRRFTVSQLPLVSTLTSAAVSSIGELKIDNLDAMHFAITTAVLHLVCDTDLNRKVRHLIGVCTTLHNTLVTDLSLSELTEVLVSIVQCNHLTFTDTPQAKTDKKVTWADVVSVLVKHGFSMDDVGKMTPEQLDAYLASLGRQNEQSTAEVKPNDDGWM